MSLALLSFALSGAGAASGAEKDKDDPLAWVPPTHVQMIPMMVPVGNTTVPITFVLEAVKRKQTEGICKRMPLVRDAILTVLSREPIPVKGRKIVTKGVDVRILNPINEAVGHTFIKRIYITPGAVKMGTAKVKRKPYAVIAGCDNILRSEKARDQALKAAQDH
ncbi:MAG: hypothetical protein HQ483_07925 [Rhodospirillales bacterium]|nr:hypothetical protein [Rhodospirillales bacterium]